MPVYYFVPFIVSNRYLLFWVSNGHNSVTVQNRIRAYMNFFDHKDLGNHLLQLCPEVVKHPVYIKPLNAELNPIRHLLALVGARHIVHGSRMMVKNLSLVSLLRWSSTIRHQMACNVTRPNVGVSRNATRWQERTLHGTQVSRKLRWCIKDATNRRVHGD